MSSCCPICNRVGLGSSTCWKEGIEEFENASELQKRFFQLLIRFIDRKTGTDHSENTTMFPIPLKNFIKIGLLSCEECLKLMESFCDLFHQLKTVELHLNWRVETLKTAMQSAQRIPSRMKYFRECIQNNASLDGSQDASVEMKKVTDSLIQFKKSLIAKCSQNMNSAMPKLLVQRWQSLDGRSSSGDIEITNNVQLGVESSQISNDEEMSHAISNAESEESETIFDNGAISITMVKMKHDNSGPIETSSSCVKNTVSKFMPVPSLDHVVSSSSKPKELISLQRQTISTEGETVTQEDSNWSNDADSNLEPSIFTEEDEFITGEATLPNKDPISEYSKAASAPSHIFGRSDLTQQPRIVKVQNSFGRNNFIKRKSTRNCKAGQPFRLQCPDCPLLFKSTEALLLHRKDSESSYNPNKCIKVNVLTTNNDTCAEEDHNFSDVFAIIDLPQEMQSCEICNISIYSSKDLEEHKLLHGTFSCQFCSFRCNYAPDLAAHEQLHFANMAKERGHGRIWCPRCDFKSLSGIFNEYVNHHLREHLHLSFNESKCTICKTHAMKLRNTTLGEHFKTHHDLTRAEDMEGIQNCLVRDCNAYFLTSRQLATHMKMRHNPKFSGRIRLTNKGLPWKEDRKTAPNYLCSQLDEDVVSAPSQEVSEEECHATATSSTSPCPLMTNDYEKGLENAASAPIENKTEEGQVVQGTLIKEEDCASSTMESISVVETQEFYHSPNFENADNNDLSEWPPQLANESVQEVRDAVISPPINELINTDELTNSIVSTTITPIPDYTNLEHLEKNNHDNVQFEGDLDVSASTITTIYAHDTPGSLDSTCKNISTGRRSGLRNTHRCTKCNRTFTSAARMQSHLDEQHDDDSHHLAEIQSDASSVMGHEDIIEDDESLCFTSSSSEEEEDDEEFEPDEVNELDELESDDDPQEFHEEKVYPETDAEVTNSDSLSKPVIDSATDKEAEASKDLVPVSRVNICNGTEPLHLGRGSCSNPRLVKRKKYRQKREPGRPSRIKCPDCDALFKDAQSILLHRKDSKSCSNSYDPSTSINVDIYAPTEASDHAVDIHDDVNYTLKIATIDLPQAIFTCDICKLSVFSSEDLEQHKKLHEIFPCKFCRAKFRYAPQLARHELRHTKKTCSRCDFKLPDQVKYYEGSYFHHFLWDHLSSLKWNEPKCAICKTNPRGLKQVTIGNHYKTQHNVSKITDSRDLMKCPSENCQAYYITMQQLNDHLRLRHNIVADARSIPGEKNCVMHKCKDCDKSYFKLPDLKKHRLRNHVGWDKTIPCSVPRCPKVFESEKNLDTHMRYATVFHKSLEDPARDKPPVPCPKCNKLVSGKHPAHLRMHKVKESLNMHRLSHTGPESWEYECSVCSKKCISKQKLEEHTKDRPFVCEVCGQKYAHRHNLRIHVNNKHGDVVQDIPRKCNRPNQTSRKGIKRKKIEDDYHSSETDSE